VGDKGKVFAFEPNPKTFEILKKNIEINRISNIKVLNIALGATPGRSVLYAPTRQSGKASLIKDLQNDAPATEVTIETLDDIVRREEIDPNKIRLVKVDVEGWEKAVIEGSKGIFSSPRAPILCVEYSTLHPSLGSTVDLYHFVVSQTPLKIYKLEKGKERLSKLVPVLSTRDLPQHDNLFCIRNDEIGTLPQKMLAQAQR
jgi:FkbM family methyltransferase